MIVALKILLINPPYLTLTSRLATGHQVPLGLLMVGGPLRDAGHEVRLLDAERQPLSCEKIVDCVHERPGKLWSILKMKNRFLRHQLLCSSFHTGRLCI